MLFPRAVSVITCMNDGHFRVARQELLYTGKKIKIKYIYRYISFTCKSCLGVGGGGRMYSIYMMMMISG